MSGSSVTRTVGQRIVKPVLSSNKNEARQRVIQLYRAWYRQLPFVALEYDLPIGLPQLKKKLREQFDKNKDVSDPRMIDLLVIKGHQELEETHHIWKMKSHVMNYFKDTVNEKPKDFLGKFYDGKE